MLRKKRFAGLLVATLFLGCENEVIIEPTGSGSGSGGQGGSAGQGGAGGEGGSIATHEAGATDIVGSGKITTSTNYKLVWTMGQSTQNQSNMSTTKYRLQGGLVGANGSGP